MSVGDIFGSAADDERALQQEEQQRQQRVAVRTHLRTHSRTHSHMSILTFTHGVV